MIKNLTVLTTGQGLTNITSKVNALIAATGLKEGLCTLFIQHTSASLIIQENADPSAQADLETWLNRLVPENDPHYTHTHEGPDDMPAHIKSVLTSTSVSIPIQHHALTLGTWQGIFLWEHRHHGGQRHLILHIS